MAFSPGIGRLGGHGWAKYFGSNNVTLTGPTASAGCGFKVATMAVAANARPVPRKARRDGTAFVVDEDDSTTTVLSLSLLLSLSVWRAARKHVEADTDRDTGGTVKALVEVMSANVNNDTSKATKP